MSVEGIRYEFWLKRTLLEDRNLEPQLKHREFQA